MAFQSRNRATTPRPIAPGAKLEADPTPRVGESWLPKFAAAGLVLLFVGLLLSFFNSNQFYVDETSYTNLKYLTKKEIDRSVEVQGYNIFYVRAREIENSVRLLPEVRDVHVTASIPNHILVDVEERRPIFIWQKANDAYWVDADGIAFSVRSNSPILPTLRDLDEGPLVPGKNARPDAFSAMAAFLSNWSNVPRLVEWSNSRGIAFTDDPGWKVYLGDSKDMGVKLAKYRAVATELIAQKAKVKFIDLSKGDPFYQ